TTGTASRDCPLTRGEHRTDRQSFRGPIDETRAERPAFIDRGAVDLRAAIDDHESPSVTDAGTERSAFEDSSTDVRSCGRGRNVEHRRRGLRERIEDGEPVDPDVAIAARRRHDSLAVSEPERPARNDPARPFPLHHTRPMPIGLTEARTVTESAPD